ncbi:CbtB-domain containing protein (plasmid) [Gemmobacter fulvus]|jgi:cobalt transporter subunit CbtB|uniref:CbtB-domain containing protein n=1 Tax=Gemmobacter fulvus TaxID=2840474 RepID=A0A975S3E7_9RHOB|nr:CbtB domain-containing protein [Gemmobacter fulvus]MBT9247888.1 CbtB-domain containing protein [Gemmobacter fulvus]QWK93139.1 CbtB-domain containing protein [Gemmobacter fulvus]
MTTTTQAITQTAGMLRPILTTAFLGTFLLFVAGFSSPDTLHASTHDTRHATGFPCH